MINRKKSILNHPILIRLLHWEYWSFGMVYCWIYPVWFFLCLRARSLFFFNASNPSIKNGGFLSESKKDIHSIAPPELMPPTLFFSAFTDPETVIDTLLSANFSYPVIGKPDTGGRGRGVKKLVNEDEVRDYAQSSIIDFHIQEFIDLPEEAGIFYFRYPGEEKGKISGIVRKEFLTVRGNGKQSISELLSTNKRAILQQDALEKMYGDKLNKVPAQGEEIVLVPYGNHARGAKFLDISYMADEDLNEVMDMACKQIKDFYFGRLDIRYKDWESLKNGKDFCIIEINGAGSEPTHIYDPRHSIFFAWKEIIRHWIILYRISKANHKLGYPYLSFKEGVKMFRDDRDHSIKLEQLSA